MKTISRKEAISQGLQFYFTGKPCKNGHISVRYRDKGNCKQCSVEWAKKNYDPDKAAKASKRWRSKNPDYADLNRDRINAISRAYRQRNKPKVAALRAANRARRKQAARFTEADVFVASEAYDLAKKRSHATGISWEVDHVIPLSSKIVCGLHCAANIQVIPASVNRRKSNKVHHLPVNALQQLTNLTERT